MNDYITIYKGKQINIQAKTIYEAQEKAKELFQRGTKRKINGWDIAIALVKKNDKQVIHLTTSL